MRLILIDKSSGSLDVINEIDVDFVPSQGECFVYEDNQPNEVVYLVDKILKPTLFKDGQKVYKMLVTKK